MTTQTDIAAILNGPNVQRINFTAEAVTISGGIYRNVANAILVGNIAITIGAPMPPGVAAQYDPRGSSLSGGVGGTLYLPSATIASPGQQAAVVHELTHAAVDSLRLARSRGLHRTENEAIAYVAGAIFMLDSGIVPGPSHRIFRLAAIEARKVIAARPRRLTISSEDMRQLRNAVGQERVYFPTRGQIRPGDGL
jgi:hypothetical protein